MPSFFPGCRGAELRSSRMRSKHFTRWAIFPAALFKSPKDRSGWRINIQNRVLKDSNLRFLSVILPWMTIYKPNTMHEILPIGNPLTCQGAVLLDLLYRGKTDQLITHVTGPTVQLPSSSRGSVWYYFTSTLTLLLYGWPYPGSSY